MELYFTPVLERFPKDFSPYGKCNQIVLPPNVLLNFGKTRPPPRSGFGVASEKFHAPRPLEYTKCLESTGQPSAPI
jgi:hypothetical protein